MESIRRERLAAGMKAVDLARAAGIDPRTLSALETGAAKNPTLNTLESIARVLRIPVARLLSDATAELCDPHPTDAGPELPEAGR